MEIDSIITLQGGVKHWAPGLALLAAQFKLMAVLLDRMECLLRRFF